MVGFMISFILGGGAATGKAEDVEVLVGGGFAQMLVDVLGVDYIFFAGIVGRIKTDLLEHFFHNRI